MAKAKNSTEHLDEITVVNPATGQVLTTTKKVFYSIYVDKGFELADRDTVAAAAPLKNGRRSGEVPRRENKSIQASGAADVAAQLGLTTRSDDAGSGVVAGGTNENDTDANESTASEERKSSGRDRGRN